MRRKAPVLLALALLAALLGGCGETGVKEIQQFYPFRLLQASTVDELQSVSDVIVVFTPERRENMLTYYSDGNIMSGYTKTDGVVSEVLKGDVSAGDTITITEECYTTDNGSVLHTQQGYLPMETGQRYLLFLTAYSEDREVFAGMYFPTELEYGKYLLSVEGGSAPPTDGEATAEELEIGPGGDLERYSSWRDQVAALYPDLF